MGFRFHRIIIIDFCLFYFIQKTDQVVFEKYKKIIKNLQKMSKNSFVFDEFW